MSDAPDDKRWEELDEYYELLRRFVEKQISRDLGPKVSVSDIVQSAIGDAYAAREQYRGNSFGEFYKWLKQTAINKLKMTYRSLHADKRDIRREQSIDKPAGPDSTAESLQVADKGVCPSQEAAANEVRERLRMAIDQLPPAYAETLRLLLLEHLTRAEIAARLGVTEGVVAGNIKRGNQQLRKLLTDILEPNPQSP